MFMNNNFDRESFWQTFEQVLIENGEPFKIVHERGRSFANVNRRKINISVYLDISPLKTKNFLRVGLYIDDRHSKIGRIILANKERINRALSFMPRWEDGVKNPDTLRVVTKFPINDSTYRELIEKSIPYIMEYIDVAVKYGKKYDFFDF